MRLRIAHSTVHRYDPPATGVIQVLRLAPRNHDGQYVIRWRIDVSADARVAAHEDAFGNVTHVFSADGPFEALTVEVDGEVETQKSDGVVRGAVERFPPSLFLRDTALTQADAAMREFAQNIHAAHGGEARTELHALLENVHHAIVADDEAGPATTTAAQAFARRRGAPQDLTHVFIGAARNLGISARYVSGYVFIECDAGPRGSHAWAEAFVPGLGWVGFDPAVGARTTEAYVRVAIGLDAMGAAPVRGARYGIGEETLAVAIRVDQ